MDKLIKNKLEKSNKTSIVEQRGQWFIGDKRISIFNTDPVNRILDGSLNGLELQGIGKFSIHLDGTDICIFTFLNDFRNKAEHVIITQTELKKRLHKLNCLDGCINLRLWLTKNSTLLESYGYGAEGEFMALHLDKKRNFTEFLNRWAILE